MARARGSPRKDSEEVHAPEEPDESIEEFLAGIGDEANRVVVYRYDATNSRQEYCGSLPWPGVDIPEEVRRLWGGGRFSVRLYGPPTRDRQSGYIGHKALSVSGPMRDLTKGAQLEADTDRDRRRAEEAEHRAAELTKLREEDRLASALQEIKDLLREVRNPPPAAENASAFRMALELVKEMQARLVPHVATPLPDGSSFLDMFKLGLEFGREASDSSGPYDRVIERVGIPLVRILETRLGPAHQLEAPANPNPPAAVDLRSALEPYVPYLITWAERNLDPGTRADLISEELPEQWHDALAELVVNGSAVTMLTSWFPNLGPHRPWVEQLIGALRENLIPEAEPAQLEEGGEV